MKKKYFCKPKKILSLILSKSRSYTNKKHDLAFNKYIQILA